MTDTDPLQRLDQTSLELADGETDLRGSHVVDIGGTDIGTVDGLLVDSGDKKVRFLDVRGGGILGIGDSQRLVPVEAVSEIEDGTVNLRHRSNEVAAAPKYDPDLVDDPDYWNGAYSAYGYRPYWGVAAYPGMFYYGRAY